MLELTAEKKKNRLEVIDINDSKKKRLYRGVTSEIWRRKARGYFNAFFEWKELTPFILMKYAADIRYRLTPCVYGVTITWA